MLIRSKKTSCAASLHLFDGLFIRLDDVVCTNLWSDKFDWVDVTKGNPSFINNIQHFIFVCLTAGNFFLLLLSCSTFCLIWLMFHLFVMRFHLFLASTNERETFPPLDKHSILQVCYKMLIKGKISIFSIYFRPSHCVVFLCVVSCSVISSAWFLSSHSIFPWIFRHFFPLWCAAQTIFVFGNTDWVILIWFVIPKAANYWKVKATNVNAYQNVQRNLSLCTYIIAI